MFYSLAKQTIFFLFHITYLPFTEISTQFIISTHPEY